MHPERVSNIKPFINIYNWKGINYPSKTDDWKMLEKNNLIIVLNILYVKEKEICLAYISKINLNCKKHRILLMIQNEEKEGWHYLALKKISITRRNNFNNSDFYCLNCLHSFRIGNKLKFYENVFLWNCNSIKKMKKCHTLFKLILNL